MANTNAPFGFIPVGTTNGPPNFRVSQRKIASNYGTKIYYGDPVQPATSTATGYIIQGAGNGSTVRIDGVFVGCQYFSTSQKRLVNSRYWPGSDATGDVTAFVIDDPNAMFKCQAGSSNIGFARTGQYVDYIIGTGSTSSGQSGSYASGPATTATLPFLIVSTVTDPPGANGTDSTSAYNLLLVSFNNEIFHSAGPTGIS